MVNMVRNASNPQAMLQNMLQSDPRMQQVNQLIQQSGGDPKKAFYTLAQQKGVNPDDILNMLK